MSVEAGKGEVAASIKALSEKIKEVDRRLNDEKEDGNKEAELCWLKQSTALYQELAALQQKENLLLAKEVGLQTSASVAGAAVAPGVASGSARSPTSVYLRIMWPVDSGEQALDTVVYPSSNAAVDVLKAFTRQGRLAETNNLEPEDLHLKDHRGADLSESLDVPGSSPEAPLQVWLRNTARLPPAARSHCSASDLTSKTLRAAQERIGFKEACSSWPFGIPNPVPPLPKYKPVAGGKEEKNTAPFYKYLGKHFLKPDWPVTLHDTHSARLFNGDTGLPLPGAPTDVTGNCDFVMTPSFIGSITTSMLEYTFVFFELTDFRPLTGSTATDAIASKSTQVIGELLLVQSQSKFRVYAATGAHQQFELFWFTDLKTLCRKRGTTEEAIAVLARIVDKHRAVCAALNADSKAPLPDEVAAGQLSRLSELTRVKRRNENSLESRRDTSQQTMHREKKHKKGSAGKKPPPPSSGAAGAGLASVAEDDGGGEDETRVGCYGLRKRTGGSVVKKTVPGPVGKRKAAAPAEEDGRCRSVAARVDPPDEEPSASGVSGSNTSISEQSIGYLDADSDCDSLPATGEDRIFDHLQRISALAADGGILDSNGGTVYDPSTVSWGWDGDRGGLISQPSSLAGWTVSIDRGSGMMDHFLLSGHPAGCLEEDWDGES
ncbi:hypothetical protein KFL_008400040 [Klebsormidium nitens]|uniref:Uncharacterized protein n=1 Tax=Klebsormidium nitens TaxID=105231 RepID=A0A1Y1ISI4_KLENI|nr:hypothetical protein KFL_008400040 [Klebsormidium nitens]|eukprot:GAQ91726.1 hypothetical protein KFL_008400040 [Klebsormidium nitens]